MKKLLFLTLISGAVLSTSVHAQANSQAAAQPQAKESAKPQAASASSAAQPMDQAALLQQMKERFKAPMVAQTGLTEAQADRVIEINLEFRMAAQGLRDLDEADRKAKITEMKADKEKKYSEIPLSPEQIKSVYAFYENMGKNMQKKEGN